MERKKVDLLTHIDFIEQKKHSKITIHRDENHNIKNVGWYLKNHSFLSKFLTRTIAIFRIGDLIFNN